jgi:selenocysteine-specific elongation factor
MVEAKLKVSDNSEVDPSKLLNINIGVLGHIDSGKTSLCKAMSTVSSTAGFDKSPQSQERGITLDLGFSAFVVAVPQWLREKEPQKLDGVEHIQFTLVDCPGHASLMKTVIGGASIIDLMILVVDC